MTYGEPMTLIFLFILGQGLEFLEYPLNSSLSVFVC